MKRYFEDYKALVLELIGVIGGLLWGKNTNWDYEPVILLIISSIGLAAFIILKLLPDYNELPLIDLDISYHGGYRSPPKLSSNSPMEIKGEGIYYSIERGAKYIFKIDFKYQLTIRNNSNFAAFNLEISCKENAPQLLFESIHNSLNPITINNPIVLKVTYSIEREMTHDEADRLMKMKYPEEIKNMVFISCYRNGENRFFYSKFYPPNSNLHNIKKKDTNKLKLKKLF